MVLLPVCAIILRTPDANAQTAACCLGDQCQLLDEDTCNTQSGDWLGLLIPPVTDCSGDPCLTGSCCHPIPEGLQCNEDDAHDTLAECLAASGTYHGGLTCGEDPCMVCPFEDAAHGQSANGEFTFNGDRTFGIYVADDFTPAASAPLSRVCYNHAYVPVPQQGGECSDLPADDSLEIHFYEDNFGIPGTELPDSPGLDVQWDSRSRQAGRLPYLALLGTDRSTCSGGVRRVLLDVDHGLWPPRLHGTLE